MYKLKFDGADLDFIWWNGQNLKGSETHPIAVDTETEKIKSITNWMGDETDIPNDPLHVAKPSLAMAYDGNILCLIHPTKLSDFIRTHKFQHWVGQNFSYDFWILMNHVNISAREILWRLGDQNKYHDTMILDLLIQLATGKYRGFESNNEDTKLYGANLGVLAKEWNCGEIDKNDEWRLRFGELLNMSEAEITAHPEFPKFTAYALGDVIATYRIYPKQRQSAIKLMQDFGWSDKPQSKYEIRPDAVKLWGPLSEAIQVKASITLAELSRTPLNIDLKKRDIIEVAARKRYDENLEILSKYSTELVKRYKRKNAGAIKKTLKSELPQFNQAELIQVLESEAKRLDVEIPISTGKKAGTSTSTKVWEYLSDKSEFIEAWVDLEKVAKLLEFVAGLKSPVIYSRYNLLMRTGRTSASTWKHKNRNILPGMNIQQIPRPHKDDPLWDLRQLVTADENHVLFTCDVVYAELRTLAASCIAKFGFSKLADVIKEHTLHGGLDPHERAALAMLDMTETEFKSRSKDDRKKIRQNVKPFSFGVPGGLGAPKLCAYAANNYNVYLTPKQAKEAKRKFLEAYPEIGTEYHLRDFSREGLAYQFQIPVKEVPVLREYHKIRISQWMRGEEELTAEEQNWFWDFLEGLANKSPIGLELLEIIEKREVTKSIQNLFQFRAANLTGLIRGNVNYSQRANFPMQSLLSAGGKEVLWALMRSGLKDKIFMHDEFVIQIPKLTADIKKKEIEHLINTTLENVIGMNIPMAVDGGLAKTWQKI